MILTRIKTIIILLVVLTFTACAKSKPVVGTDQIQKDLVGQTVEYPALGKLSLIPENIKNISIEDRRTDMKSGTDEVHTLAKIATSDAMIKGKLVCRYKLYDQGWKLEGISQGTYDREPKPPTLITFIVKNKFDNKSEKVSIMPGGKKVLSTGDVIEVIEYGLNEHVEGTNGPAAKIRVTHGNEKPYTFVVFKNYPDGSNRQMDELLILIDKFEL